MDYGQYLKLTQEAASTIRRGMYVSLAGGFYGVRFPIDGAFVLLALDLDEDSGWCAWVEDEDGERACDCTQDVGWVSLDELELTAVKAVVHRCPL